MRIKKFSERKWYNGAVVACIGVAFYVLLTNLSSVTSYLSWFLGSFKSIFLGVSGLLILVSSIVFGNLFGILGVLLSIPAATILSFVYHEYLLPRQEERMRKIVEEEKRSAGK